MLALRFSSNIVQIGTDSLQIKIQNKMWISVTFTMYNFHVVWYCAVILLEGMDVHIHMSLSYVSNILTMHEIRAHDSGANLSSYTYETYLNIIYFSFPNNIFRIILHSSICGFECVIINIMIIIVIVSH